MLFNRAITIALVALFTCSAQPAHAMKMLATHTKNAKNFYKQSKAAWNYWNSPACEQILLFEQKVQEYEEYLERSWFGIIHEGGPNYRYIKGDKHHQFADELCAIAKKGLSYDSARFSSYLVDNFDRFKSQKYHNIFDRNCVHQDVAKGYVVFFKQLIKETRLLDDLLIAKYLQDFNKCMPLNIERAKHLTYEEKYNLHYIFSEGKLKILSTLLKYSNKSAQFIEHAQKGFEVLSIAQPRILRIIIEKNSDASNSFVQKYINLPLYSDNYTEHPIITLIDSKKDIPHFNEKLISYIIKSSIGHIDSDIIRVHKNNQKEFNCEPDCDANRKLKPEDYQRRYEYKYEDKSNEYKWKKTAYNLYLEYQSLVCDRFFLFVFPYLMKNPSLFIKPLFTQFTQQIYPDIHTKALHTLLQEYPETHKALLNYLPNFLSKVVPIKDKHDLTRIELLEPLIETLSRINSEDITNFFKDCLPTIQLLAKQQDTKSIASLLQVKYDQLFTIPRKVKEAERLINILEAKKDFINSAPQSLASMRADNNPINEMYARAQNRAYMIGKQVNPEIKDYSEFMDDVRARTQTLTNFSNHLKI